MEGYVTKRGKRIGSRVKRYMRLYGPILSNHHTERDDPTWTINISEAIITCNSKKNRIAIELFRNKLELFTDTYAECDAWYEALMNEKCRASLAAGAGAGAGAKAGIGMGAGAKAGTGVGAFGSRESSGVVKTDTVKIVSVTSDEIAEKRVEFGRGFKVITNEPPVAKKLSSSLNTTDSDNDIDDDDDDDDTLPLGETLIVNGQVYEETPASMIFKQFNSPLTGSD